MILFALVLSAFLVTVTLLAARARPGPNRAYGRSALAAFVFMVWAISIGHEVVAANAATRWSAVTCSVRFRITCGWWSSIRARVLF